MIALMVPFRIFSFLDFLADLLQKSISVASNLFACCVFSVHVSAPYSKIKLKITPSFHMFHVLLRSHKVSLWIINTFRLDTDQWFILAPRVKIT
jgi:hypothetical protein